MDQKVCYPIEEQINDCYEYLGFTRKDAFEMDEAELAEAERELSEYFVWEEHPGCLQAVPKNIETGAVIF